MPKHSEAILAAIKNSVDLVSLVGEYLTLHRSGSKYKALCPFHDDHNPSLDRIPNASRSSAGVAGPAATFSILSRPTNESISPRRCACWPIEPAWPWILPNPATPRPPLRAVRRKPTCAKSSPGPKRAFVDALAESTERDSYVARRRISAESVARFRLGHAPDSRDWLQAKARRDRVSPALLERAGLIVPHPRITRPRPRAISGPADLPDPRRPRADAGLRRPDSARNRARPPPRSAASLNILTRPRPRCSTSGASCTGDLARVAGPIGRLGGGGRGLHRRDRRAPGRAGECGRHPGHRLGRRSLRALCAAWPIGSCWSSTGTRPGSRRRTGRWSCSWATSWTSAC